MHSQSIFRRIALVLSPVLFLCAALGTTTEGPLNVPATTSATSAQGSCAATTDAEIVAAIQEKIKADARFDDQRKHINVSSRNRVVKLSGWVKGRRQMMDLITFARTTHCVRRVVNKLKPFRKVGCSAGQKQCGDTCIDRNEQCNIIQDSNPPQ